MDIDPGLLSPFSPILYTTFNIHLDIEHQAAPVRLLPYSLIPGISLSSPLFFKAVSVIAKQQNSPLTTSSASSSKGKKSQPGKFIHFLTHFIGSKIINSILDPLTKFLNGSDFDLVTRARDVVANSILTEISKEDPQGNAEYQDAVRHQIVALFQRLRLSLLVLDTLMEAYNASN